MVALVWAKFLPKPNPTSDDPRGPPVTFADLRLASLPFDLLSPTSDLPSRAPICGWLPTSLLFVDSWICFGFDVIVRCYFGIHISSDNSSIVTWCSIIVCCWAFAVMDIKSVTTFVAFGITIPVVSAIPSGSAAKRSTLAALVMSYCPLGSGLGRGARTGSDYSLGGRTYGRGGCASGSGSGRLIAHQASALVSKDSMVSISVSRLSLPLLL
ncbi:hypothetical protein Acr_07g0002900 [Actinidia rufa]|uniref:Uncharacterized protein n=1 Tax=Actinidia rufa TaxID=165716 RepID=A0A7J0EUK2_9ERIC|nr:hypothetical protein Acr_07g0002900 [Actinidia rufa]